MNLFITGAAKTGITSLYYYLEQHSQIIAPKVKEPHYFSHVNRSETVFFPKGNGIGDGSTIWIHEAEEYRNFSPNNHKKEQDKCYMDAAVTNLYGETTSQEIIKYDPESKIIITLHNFIDRAWSHYNHLVRDGREKKPFEKGLKLEKERIQKRYEFSWHYKNMGLYDKQVERYLKTFPKDQFLILLFEEFITNTSKALKQVTEF